MICFVTVGTTRFDQLVNEVLKEDCISKLKSLGISKIRIQLGAGEWNDDVRKRIFRGVIGDEGEGESDGVTVEFYRYKSNIQSDMDDASYWFFKIVIGHAGAGTCLECLKLRRPLIVVLNEDLMNNHQLELAKELARRGHLLYCRVPQLCATLSDPALFSLNPFKPPDQYLVAKYIDNLMGITPSLVTF
ncbi:glycosyltransferase family 28 protein [Dictyocaulus viviparus]|uniref:UDP-N-acetylglucosamine transferase subunit ALG13 n=1 Tax=Dictyocaulus viviparus TaxID=29172 RepID=A0A0D8XVB8_DICVI|nr:glycosyltransferase family 28 protein [Dictyocaulus viviparus]